MKNELPPILYKYLPPNRVEEFLEQPFMYFSGIHSLNDPRETMILGAVHHSKNIKNLSPEQSNKFKNNVIQNLEDTNKIGIYSLSQEPNIDALWAHYCQQPYLGMVVGINTQSIIDHLNKQQHCERVGDYAHYPIEYKKWDELRNKQKEIIEGMKECPSDVETFRWKVDNWSNEQEYRFVVSFKVSDEEINEYYQKINKDYEKIVLDPSKEGDCLNVFNTLLDERRKISLSHEDVQEVYFYRMPLILHDPHKGVLQYAHQYLARKNFPNAKVNWYDPEKKGSFSPCCVTISFSEDLKVYSYLKTITFLEDFKRCYLNTEDDGGSLDEFLARSREKLRPMIFSLSLLKDLYYKVQQLDESCLKAQDLLGSRRERLRDSDNILKKYMEWFTDFYQNFLQVMEQVMEYVGDGKNDIFYRSAKWYLELYLNDLLKKREEILLKIRGNK